MNCAPAADARLTTRLVLIRHGETEWNVEGRYQGQADPALTPAGLAQARDVAGRLRRARIDALYSSPLRRALDTAGLIAARLRLPVRTDPRLMEIHLGRWQGLLTDEIIAADPGLFAAWQLAPGETTPPGGERLEQVRARVHAAIDEIVAAHRGGRIGVVTHRIPIVLLLIRYLGVPATGIHAISVPNAGWVALDLREGRPAGRPRLSSPAFVDAAEQPLV